MKFSFYTKSTILLLGASLLLAFCKTKTAKVEKNSLAATVEPKQQHCVKKLTDIIIKDIFSAPVASRIYAYSNLAFYEGIITGKENSQSIAAQLKGFGPMPIAEENKAYNNKVVAIEAYYTTAENFVFSKDAIKNIAMQDLSFYKNTIDKSVFENSVALGKAIAKSIIQRAEADNYKETRGMPKHSVVVEEGKWEQTPPDYADAAEPHWQKMKTFLLDSATQFKPAPPPPYSLDKKSQYYKELIELYDISKNLTPEQDTIAKFWDDNAYVTQYEGHLMYANKKTTPAGHWQGITSIVCDQQKLDEVQTAKAFAMLGAAQFDAFIACWQEKFSTLMVRPITVIQDHFDADWSSLLQTPPFPEYTSGHSTISGAAAVVLTKLVGDNIAFTDTTEVEYLGIKRNFTSFNQAANETSISRLYGGIHYKSALDNGLKQGQDIGNLYLKKIQ